MLGSNIFALALLLLSLWSAYMVIWKFDASRKFFMLKHSLILIASGSFGSFMMFLMAMGSVGHSVRNYEIYEENIFIAFCLATFFVSTVGLFTLIVKALRYLFRKKNP